MTLVLHATWNKSTSKQLLFSLPTIAKTTFISKPNGKTKTKKKKSYLEYTIISFTIGIIQSQQFAITQP
jgi:hypothetical protein